MTYGKPRAMQPETRVPPAGPSEEWRPLDMKKWQHLRSDLWRRSGGLVTLTDSRKVEVLNADE